ncbi:MULTISPECIES: glycine dehydrogenase [Mangrovibacter]|uniref:PRD domain protein (TIGR03582 family) n=1 Tax=Mangrovibacter plantisponsor TaxID=451513 RepID=A0A317PNS6_9ENTR|nr:MULTISPECIES: glycine dehydrogenase [Mangrovibacter]PWW01016.1 PRD domain protein (TIGR03582 family) [Mangrovibacter plantisponsor]
MALNTGASQEEHAAALAGQVLRQVEQLLAEKGIFPTPVQQQMLVSHLRAMAWRSVSGEPLPEVDASLFDEIPQPAMQLAKTVVDIFGNLPQEEVWLLSVHFAVAKENGVS